MAERFYPNPFLRSTPTPAALLAATQGGGRDQTAARDASKRGEEKSLAAGGVGVGVGGGAAASSSLDFASSSSLLSSCLSSFLHTVCSEFPLTSRTGGGGDAYAYEGVAGVAWMMLHLSRASEWLQSHLAPSAGSGAQGEKVREWMTEAGERGASLAQLSLQYALQSCKMLLESHSRHASSHPHARPTPPTFYCGSGGVWATLALAALRVGDHARLDQAIQGLMDAGEALRDERLPDEILYGRAGYLHALVLVHSSLAKVQPSHSALKALRSRADEAFDQILSRGLRFEPKDPDCPLMWQWHGSRYLGAAHGVTGIVSTLLLCEWRFAPEAADGERLRRLVVQELDYCLSLRLPSGNFPSSIPEPDEGGQVRSPSDRLVQWCHGAPALALSLLRAHEVLGVEEENDRFLQAAVEASEVTWNRGLLTKGLGLCHGLAGNAYVFLKLYESTRDGAWLDRSLAFASFGLRSEHAAQLAARPDVPSSLANGRAGFSCFAADLLNLLATHAGAGARVSASAASASASAAAAAKEWRVCFPGMDLLD